VGEWGGGPSTRTERAACDASGPRAGVVGMREGASGRVCLTGTALASINAEHGALLRSI
jgi:hypothetical protein